MDKRQEGTGVKSPGMAEESAVQVCVRLRPPNAREKSLQGGSGTHPEVHWKTDNQTISQINGGKSFSFDRVFHENETTQTIYTEVAHSIVYSITEGYNGTIFAYGQTSSGKTYTMMGNANTPGLIPLAICNLFKVINDMQNREFLLRVSYLEIYNESVSDLLSDSKGKPLEIREDIERNIYVAELIEEVAVTFEDVMKWVKKGERNRHYGETKMNERSSRSHTIFRVIVESRDKSNEAVKVAHLNLVDLAGSERASQTGAEGVRLKEGCNINRSLFVLGQVIKKLSDGQSGFLNYRDSKLTRILQNSLGGNARTLIICTIAPFAFEETLSTLQFASTAKFMKNTPHVNEVLDDQAMLKRCRKEIMDLKNHLEELASETRVHEMEKAQLLSEKYHLQLEHEQKIKNLTRMLVRVLPDEDQLSAKARRKRRFTWAPGKVRASLTTVTDNAAKMIKLDQAFQELDEFPEEIPDDMIQSDMIPSCSSQITVKRGGSLGYQVPSFEDSSYFRDQSQISFTGSNFFHSILYDESPNDDLKKRISELENELDLTKEKEKQNVHLRSDVESLKMENDEHKEEIRQLKQLLEEKERTEKYFKMENDKQNDEIEELKRLRDCYEERREIEEFEFLEKVVEKEEKAQQKHEIAKLKELVRNSEVYNQELEAELMTKTDQLKEQQQKLLVLQKRLDELRELSDGQTDLETLIDQNKHLQQSLNDAEVVTCDAKKKSAILRSENLELKETMNEMTMKYQQMEKDVQLYCKKLDTEQSRYKQMQSDLQKELKSVYSENVKLISLLDGKVPKDVLDRVHLEKSIADLNQQLEKAKNENISLQQEVTFLSQNNLLPEKIDELEKQVLKLTEERNGVTSERDNLLVGKEENDNQLANLRGEVSLIVQERDKLQEAVNSLQNERIHQENLNAEQQKEIQCRMESFKTELELYCRQLEEERAKCSQLQHNIEDKEGKVKELEQQLTHEIVKQNEINDKLSKASEDIKLLNEVKEELMTKLQVLTEDNEERALSQPKSQKINQDEDLLNVSSAVETTVIKNLTEQLLILEENCKTISEEKENLCKELLGLQTERDQLKCDLQENIEMCIENQAELRRLHDKLKLKQDVEVELKKSLADKEFLINEEKKKASEALDRAQEEVQYQQQLVKELKTEIQENKDLLLSIQTNNPEIIDKKQKEVDELYCLEAERKAILTETEEIRVHAFKEQEAEIQKEHLKQQLQQLENDKLTLSQEKDNLLETLKCIRAEKDEMKRVLEEKTEVTQKQGEELLHTVSQRDMLLAEIEELKDHISKEKQAESLEDEFSQKLQRLEDEKSSLVIERNELHEKLRCIEVEKEEMKILHGNAEMMQRQAEELHLNSLLDESKNLRAQVSKEHEAVIQEDEFHQRFQQLEDEKSCLLKERDELQEMLKCVKAEQDEMKKILQENSVVAQKQEEELHHTVSQRDMLLAEIETLRTCVSNEEQVEIQEKEFNQQIQQLKDEKSCLLKERDELQEMLKVVRAKQDEMKKVLQENSEVAQEQEEELQHTVSQRDMLLAEIETLRARVSKEEEVDLQEKEFCQRFQQLEDEKSCLLKERDELQEMLKCIKAEQGEMKTVLQENSEMAQKQAEEFQHTVSQRDMLLAEIERLRSRVSKEEEVEIREKELNQQFQQLEDEKSCLIKERDELQKTLKVIKAEQDEMKKVLQENSKAQKQAEEFQHTVSQRDMLLAEIERLRSHVSKGEEVEIREEELNQQFQQLEDEKSCLIKERDELQKTLEVIKAEQDEMKKVLQETSEVTQKEAEELQHTVSQRDMLLAEIERLRSRVSKEEEVEIREKEFYQQFQQLEDEKSCLIKERDELQETLKVIKAEQGEMKKVLQKNSEVAQKQEEELQHTVSQRDMLLAEIERLRSRVSKEEEVEIQEKEFNLRIQQLEDEKSCLLKERDELHEKLKCIKAEQEEMKKVLPESSEVLKMEERRDEELTKMDMSLEKHIVALKDKTLTESITPENKEIQAEVNKLSNHLQEKDSLLQTQKQAEELQHTVSQRDMLLAEIERLRSRVSKEEEVEIREKEFNQRIQQLEDEKSCLLKERDELHEKLKCIKAEQEVMKKVLPESSEVLKMEKRRDEELSKMDTSLEKQIFALKDKTLTESTTPENEEIQAEVNKLSNRLQEKDCLLQETIQSLFQLENEYKIELAKTDQQLSREGEEWNELLVKFCSMFPEESAESISIKKLQEENQKLYEQLLLWRSHFLRVMSTVPQNIKRYQVLITECDLGLADEKRKNEELCIQLKSLKKHVSDSPLLELTSEEKNPEILRLSTLINLKENHLMNAQKILSDLKLKYQNYLRSTKNGLSSKAEARQVLQERISNASFTNASKTIEEIEDGIRILNQELQLQNETVRNEATFSRSKQNGYVMYIRNTWNQVGNQEKENEKLLLEIETVRRQSLNKNGYDPILAMENQKLKEKMKTDEQLFQTMGTKIQELKMALTTSQETNKLQEGKITQLQTELSSRTSENKLEDLQTSLLKKDNQINILEEAVKQLQAKLDLGAQPCEEMKELKNRLFILEMEKVKESNNYEKQISSLKASLEHNKELCRQTKEKLRRYQQEQDTTIMFESNNEKCSTDESLTCGGGSGIVQNALVLVLKSEKAKLIQDLNCVKKENARLARTMSELKYENAKWKEKAFKLQGKGRVSSEHQRETDPPTLTLCPEEDITPCSLTEQSRVSKVKTSEFLFPEIKTGAKQDENSLTSEKVLTLDSPKVSSFGTESKWLLPCSKIFDNSQLGFSEAGSPQRKPISGENERVDWWPKPSASDPQCKMQ
ncbi:centromere-associated protein E-like isoform X2 [Mobula hypostoma]|uniref:centromere-associated protein E-like isoform X2 n=1 Tax=Mobula hypostoma TaxID=723540 RepID=UPI002FC31100